MAVNHKGMIALQRQPSGRRTPTLIAKFERFETIIAVTMPVTDSKGCLTTCFQHVPIGSKLLSFAKKGEDESSFVLKFGVYRTPMQWIDRALVLQHPFDTSHAVPDKMLDVLFFILTTAPAEVCHYRASKLKLWMRGQRNWRRRKGSTKNVLILRLVKSLRPKGSCCSGGLPTVCIGLIPTCVTKLIRALNPLVSRDLPMSSGLNPGPPQASEKEFWDNAKFIRPALIGKVKNSAFDAESQPLWDAKLEEAENHHWMSGPHTVEQVHDSFKGQPWIPVRRFGVLQSKKKNKLRPIYDLAENKVNSAYGYSYKLDMRALDQIVWVTAAITRAVTMGRVCFRRSNGVLLRGKVHPGYLTGGDHHSFLFWISHRRANNLPSAVTAGVSLPSPLRILQTEFANVSLAMCCPLVR